MWAWWQDLRYGARLLVKQPGFTLTAVGVLTLGIGVNAGIFGLINNRLLKPRPGDGAPGQVVAAHNAAMVGVNEGTVTRQSFADVVSAGYFDA